MHAYKNDTHVYYSWSLPEHQTTLLGCLVLGSPLYNIFCINMWGAVVLRAVLSISFLTARRDRGSNPFGGRLEEDIKMYVLFFRFNKARKRNLYSISKDLF